MPLLVPLLLACASGPPSVSEPAASDPLDVDAALRAAGRAGSEDERLAELEALSDALPADHVLRADLDILLPTVRRWARPEDAWAPGPQSGGEQGFLSSWITLQVWPDRGAALVPPEPSTRSAELHALWALYRGRALVWNAVEHGIDEDAAFDEADTRFDEVVAAFPNNRAAHLYRGGRAGTWTGHPPVDGVPDWALAQSEALEKTAAIVDWWIDHRQQADGQLGGGWGDDVEQWRWWRPVLLGFVAPEREAAWLRLSAGIWSLDDLAGGYAAHPTDVEHAAEDTADTLTPLLQLDAGAPWTGLAADLATLADAVWLQENHRGLRQFPSTVFGADEVTLQDGLACDTPRHTRALQPALLAWSLGVEIDSAPLEAWLTTWADAAMRSSGDKPAGTPPAAIHWPSGEAAGGTEWWDPGCYASDAYAFPKGLDLLMPALVLGAWAGEAPDLLRPVAELAVARRATLAGDLDAETEGSLGWAAWRGRRGLSTALAKAWLLGLDDTYVDVLAADGGSYARLLLSGEEASLQQDLDDTVRALRLDMDAYTAEVRFTDRALKLPSRYLDDRTDGGQPSPDTDLLYEMLTGDLGGPTVLPLPVVRWDTAVQDFAARVVARDGDAFTAEVVHLGDGEREVGAVLLRGASTWSLDCDGVETGGVVEGPTVALVLPARTVCVLEVQP